MSYAYCRKPEYCAAGVWFSAILLFDIYFVFPTLKSKKRVSPSTVRLDFSNLKYPKAISLHYRPTKHLRFFATLRMTMLCIDYGWEEVGWRLRRQPTSSQKPNLFIACHSERSEESNKLKKLIETIFIGQ